MKTAHRAPLALLPLAALASCQTYDFEPVVPLAIAQTTQTKTVTAKQLKPDLMILIDKSGSMSAPLAGGVGCGTCAYPACNEATCPTRMGQMHAVMQQFLQNNGRVARMGLTIFPHDTVCSPSQDIDQKVAITPASDSDTDLQTWANGVNTEVQNTSPGGGTPTGQSLVFAGGRPELNDAQREDFILLLTDGLPNCNSTNPNTCTMPATCKCTLNGGNCGTTVNDSDPNNFCRRGCLDEDGAVQAIRDLRDTGTHAGGIRTIVVGFGSDFSSNPDGFNVLNAMAIAGGFQRLCPNGTAQECGGAACNAGVCATAFYAATNATELATALAQISDNLAGDSICKYTLEAQPTSADLVSVIIDGSPVASGANTWNLTNGQIVFPDTGASSICAKLKASTTTNPVKVEIRVVQSL